MKPKLALQRKHNGLRLAAAALVASSIAYDLGASHAKPRMSSATLIPAAVATLAAPLPASAPPATAPHVVDDATLGRRIGGRGSWNFDDTTPLAPTTPTNTGFTS